MSHFFMPKKVFFQDCDPAGIVFYPRYFEMINLTVETWFDEALNMSFSVLHEDRGLAIPTVHIETGFSAPSRLGDPLTFTLTVKKLGGSSMDLEIQALCGTEVRLTSDLTLVCVNKAEIKPMRWPDDIRQNIEELLKESQ